MNKKIVLSSFLGPLCIEWSEKGLEHIDIDLQAKPAKGSSQEDLPAWLQEFITEMQLYLERAQPFSKLPKINEEQWTPFQKEIYLQLFATAPGETLTYGQLAERCHRPKAARSVGAAMSRNKLPVLIPCHRVLPAGGKLGQYSGGEGPLSKQKLLSFEKGHFQLELCDTSLIT